MCKTFKEKKKQKNPKKLFLSDLVTKQVNLFIFMKICLTNQLKLIFQNKDGLGLCSKNAKDIESCLRLLQTDIVNKNYQSGCTILVKKFKLLI